jgi:hydrogenase maturation protease
LVIGYGNTLRSDDGAGVRAAELIRERVPGLDVITVHELQPELVDAIASRENVVFIDAAVAVEAVTCRRIDAGLPAPPLASHLLTPGQLLALCASLYGNSPQNAALIEIPARIFDFGESFSAIASTSVEQSVGILQSLLATWGWLPVS